MKTWKDIRTQALNLGFEKTKTYEKNKQSYIDAYNWANGLIAATIGGVLGKIGIGCDGNHRHIFDLHQLAQAKGWEFIAMAQSGVMDTKNNTVSGWALADNRYLTMPPHYKGYAVVNVLVMPAPLTASHSDDTLCPLPAKWVNLLPYLMANRLYLDDDAAKAGYYWNLYTDMRDEMLKKENTPHIAVNGGADIDRWCI